MKKQIWEEQEDFCDRAEQQKREIFDLTMTQAVRAWAFSK